MLPLTLESAPYTELDFPKFNPAGFRRIQQAVEMAQQQKALARSVDELKQATDGLRAAVDRKNLEQQIAQMNFDLQRQRAFERLQKLQASFRAARLKGAKRLDAETRIDHLVTLFHLKDFDGVMRQLPAAENMLDPKPRRFMAVSSPSAHRTNTAYSQSATALFLQAQNLERAGQISRAVEVYGRVLERNPRHFQARHRLDQISSRAPKPRW